MKISFCYLYEILLYLSNVSLVIEYTDMGIKSISVVLLSSSAPRLARTRNASFRRSVRNSTRSADSGFAAFSDCSPAYHSDSDLRYSFYKRTTTVRISNIYLHITDTIGSQPKSTYCTWFSIFGTYIL